MSVEVVNTNVIKCVKISWAATDALVKTDTHSYLITQHVKVRKSNLFIYCFSYRDIKHEHNWKFGTRYISEHTT